MDDQIVASSNWLYVTMRRQHHDAEAAQVLERITPGMKVVEDKMYFALLLFYKGLKQESEIFHPGLTDIEDATIGYGVGNWHLYNGHPARAHAIFRQVVAGREWAAFGFICAETELARGGTPARRATLSTALSDRRSASGPPGPGSCSERS